jgi:hypothetical protein
MGNYVINYRADAHQYVAGDVTRSQFSDHSSTLTKRRCNTTYQEGVIAPQWEVIIDNHEQSCHSLVPPLCLVEPQFGQGASQTRLCSNAA